MSALFIFACSGDDEGETVVPCISDQIFSQSRGNCNVSLSVVKPLGRLTSITAILLNKYTKQNDFKNNKIFRKKENIQIYI